MNSRFFPKKDELLLSTVTVLVVGGLFYQGFSALTHTKEHTIFQKSSNTSKNHVAHAII